MAEHTHSGDACKTAFVLGDSIGWHCFSDDCADYTIKDVLEKITRLAGKPYPGNHFHDDLLEAEALERLLNAPVVDGDSEAAATSDNMEEAGDPLLFPEEALYGRLGELAKGMKMPLGLAFPAVLGAYSVLPTADTMGAGTRVNLYVILLAPPGGGKNVAIARALEITSVPKEDLRKAAPVSDRGLMSLVGHRKKRSRDGEKMSRRDRESSSSSPTKQRMSSRKQTSLIALLVQHSANSGTKTSMRPWIATALRSATAV